MSLAWIGAALGAPVELPAGMDIGQWQTALSLADLDAIAPGTLGPRAGVRLTIDDNRLSIWVRDIHGAEHTLSVPVPVTSRERESVAALASSLVQPVEAPSIALPALPPLPAPPKLKVATPSRPSPAPPSIAPDPPLSAQQPPPTEPAPIDTIVSSPEPIQIAAVPSLPSLDDNAGKPAAETDAAAMVAPKISVVSPPPSEALLTEHGAGWFLAVGPSMRLRPNLRSMAAASLSGGKSVGPWQLALGLEWVAPAKLLDLGVEGRLSVLDLRVLPAWRYHSVTIGPSIGLSGRYATEPVQSPPPILLPTAGAALSYTQRLADHLALRPTLLAEMDLVKVALEQGDRQVGYVHPFSMCLGITAAIGRR